MMSVVYNFHKTYVHQRVESAALKAAYMLSRKTVSAGTTCMDMDLKKKHSKAPLFEQLDIIEHTSRYNHKFQKEVRVMRTAMKALYKSGKKTQRMQTMRWEGEALIRATFQTLMDEHDGVMKNFGLSEFIDLSAETDFQVYALNDNPEDSSGNRLTASELMQMRLYSNSVGEDAEEPEIFMLDAGFLSDRNERPVYSIGDAEAESSENPYMHYCFTLYGINRLTADELKTARREINAQESHFQQQMNHWIDMCYFSDDTSDTLGFYKENIIPAAAMLQQKIEGCTLVNDSSDAALQTEVWIGEMPVAQLWNYYREQNIIKDKTWQKLSHLCKDEDYQNKRWPVMALRIPKEQLEQLETDDPEKEMQAEEEPANEVFEEAAFSEILPVKKYLLID